MQTIINIIVFILILGTIITIHEFGHFIAAKHFGVYCAQFSIGFGPKLFSKKGKETEFELRLLPIGGFVSMAGEADQEDNEMMKDVPFERTLKGIKAYQRVIVFVAGVFMNMVLAVAVLLAANLMSGTVPLDDVTIASIQQDSAAYNCGLQVNDVITKLYIEESNTTFVIDSYDDLPDTFDKTSFHTNSDTVHMIISIIRNNETKELNATLSFNQDESRYILGVSYQTRRMNFIESVTSTADDFIYMSTAIVDALRMLVVNFAGTVNQLSGPAGIYQVTAEVTQTGQISYIFRLVGLLSINIGIFNLLPIPGLDGCQILFTIVERIIGRELPQRMKLILQMIGLALVMLLMIYVTYQDLVKIFS
jgi:regulator of sigma E protease